jgi:hypothetical protein
VETFKTFLCTKRNGKFRSVEFYYSEVVAFWQSPQISCQLGHDVYARARFRDVTLDRARPLCQVIHKKRKPEIFEKITKTVVVFAFLRPLTAIGQRR